MGDKLSKSQSKKVALVGMLIAAAFIFSYLESMLPVFFGIPGIKPGLANIVTIFAIYKLSIPYVFLIALVRVVLSGLTFSGMYGILYSLAGGIISILIMLLLKKTKLFGTVGVSVAGGVAHNIGQILVALIVLGKAVLYYFPFLLLAGVLAGLLVGIVGAIILKLLKSNPILSFLQNSK